MTRAEEIALNEQNKESNLRYIRAKIGYANANQMAMIKGFIRGIGVIGWDHAEYHRPIKENTEEDTKNEVL